MDVIGHYVDYSMTSPYAMAVRSAEIKERSEELARRDILLVNTCLRIELYGSRREVERTSPTIMNGAPVEVVKSSDDVVCRLAQIAAGAQSQILGESYIAQQLSEAVKLLSPKSKVRQLTETALRLGDEARRHNLFRADANYDNIVIDLVDDCLGQQERGETLYLVGAGMLGRSILFSGLPRRFITTCMLTRDPKALRKKLRGVAIPGLSFLHPDRLTFRPEKRSVVVIATNGVSDSYRCKLEEMVRTVEPRKVVELSSLPAFAEAFGDWPEYTNMYSDEFLRIVDRNNESLRGKAACVRQFIAESLQSVPAQLG